MAEAVDTPVEGGKDSPWYREFGLESEEDVKNAFLAQKKKTEDLTKYKSKAKEATVLEKELEQLRAEKQQRLDAERSELEKVQARAAELENKLKEKDAAISQAQRNILFERALSTRLAGASDKDRQIKRMLYEAAITKSDGFEDEETLALLLDPVDELLQDDSEPQGKRVLQRPGATPQAAPQSQKVKDFNQLSPDELLRLAKNRRK